MHLAARPEVAVDTERYYEFAVEEETASQDIFK
jgi:hypothetical protein